jgi:hypothetical protein
MPACERIHKKLGDLLIFISKVAISARMNTAYNSSSAQNPETPLAAMWLTDMLHNFQGLGEALSDDDMDGAIRELEKLKAIWLADKEDIELSCAVNPHGQEWSVDEGIALLDDLKFSLLRR